MITLRCPEHIQCKYICQVSADSRRTGILVVFSERSSKFVSIRHCSARYLKAWAKRNARRSINQKMAYCLGIASVGAMILNAVGNRPIALNPAVWRLSMIDSVNYLTEAMAIIVVLVARWFLNICKKSVINVQVSRATGVKITIEIPP